MVAFKAHNILVGIMVINRGFLVGSLLGSILNMGFYNCWDLGRGAGGSRLLLALVEVSMIEGWPMILRSTY